MFFNFNKGKIHFSGRRHTKTGIFATIIGAVVVAGFTAISFVSGLNKGNGGLALGLIGILLFFTAIAGFVLAYKAFKKKDIYYHFPIIGAFINGFMIIILLILYVLGI